MSSPLGSKYGAAPCSLQDLLLNKLCEICLHSSFHGGCPQVVIVNKLFTLARSLARSLALCVSLFLFISLCARSRPLSMVVRETLSFPPPFVPPLGKETVFIIVCVLVFIIEQVLPQLRVQGVAKLRITIRLSESQDCSNALR